MTTKRLTAAHAAQLKARGLDPVLAESLGVHSTAGREGLMVLAMDYLLPDRRVHNVKTRYGKGDMPWAETGKRLIPWGLETLTGDVHPDEALIICEGEMDRVALHQVGYRRVLSVPNGAPARSNESGDKRYTYLYSDRDRILPDIDKFQTIVLAVDGDRPGMSLRDDLAVRLGDERCLWVEWPEGCKDANDVLLRHGGTALIDCIASAKRMWLDLVAPLSEIPDQPPEIGLQIGLDVMDDPIEAGGIRLPAHGFLTIVGPAGVGKSTFARQIAWQLWRLHGMPIAITALEEDAKPRYQRAFRRLAIGKPISDWTHGEVTQADDELEQALRIIQRPRGGLMHLEQLLGVVEYTIKVYGSKLIMIDPVNEVEHDDGVQRGDVAARTLIMALKDIAQRYRVLVMAVTHPPVDVVRRKKLGELWTLYDVENGRHWAGKSDAGIGVWQPHPRGPTIAHVCKLKSHEIFGKTNLFMLQHDRGLDRFACTRSGYDIAAQVVADMEAGIYDQQPTRPATVHNGVIFSRG